MAEPQDKPTEHLDIPDELPLLPIRDLVVFPSMVLPLFVGREISVKAVEATANSQRMILLVAQKTMNLEDPGRLADLIISNLSQKVEVAQGVLETLDPVDRLKRVSEILAKELEVLNVQQKIQAEAKGEIDKTQKEYYLREQLKAIQRE